MTAASLGGSTTSTSPKVPTRCLALSDTDSSRKLWNVTHTVGPLCMTGAEATHRGSLRLGSKQTVWFGQGFATCMKRTDLAGNCTPLQQRSQV